MEKPFRFFDLPAELRDQVYGYFFEARLVKLLYTMNFRRFRREKPGMPCQSNKRLDDVLVSKLWYTETIACFYASRIIIAARPKYILNLAALPVAEHITNISISCNNSADVLKAAGAFSRMKRVKVARLYIWYMRIPPMRVIGGPQGAQSISTPDSCPPVVRVDSLIAAALARYIESGPQIHATRVQRFRKAYKRLLHMFARRAQVLAVSARANYEIYVGTQTRGNMLNLLDEEESIGLEDLQQIGEI